MEIVLRNPIPGDIGWLISMHGRIYAEQFEFDSNFERDIAKKVMAFLEKQDPFNMLWVAAVNNEPIGSIAVSLRPDQTAFINFLLVETEYRGCGVAKTLMDRVVSHCKDHGIRLLCLETYSCLKAARELYRKYGFTLSTKNVAVKMYGQSFDQEFWQKVL
ncbi:GNAT family N-acetyltransferase [Azoarcus sp. KH32C]|uniref:GNAT family N-acetyltransferase n=1 Tax=Azoarcus sp. KH32C TaxID=748247 RepID=UPI0002386181|nr:GNAT family N-acetyltransferase [Azoarcus sp. KH32C]BAL25658.1 putative GnaT-family acetyltransferase [Azoarcus sp. KH32C]